MSNEHFIKSFDNADIWYEIRGKGENTLFLVDGIACDGYVWKYIKPYFENNYKIIHFNYRGHGKTPSPDNYSSITIENSTKDMNAIMDVEKIDKAVFLGHSMGVQVILEMFRQFPEKVKGLIPMCGSYGQPFKSYHNTDKIEIIAKLLVNLFFKPKPKIIDTLKKVTTFKLSYLFATNTEVNGKMLKREDFMPYLESLRYTLDFKAFGYMLESAIEHTTIDILPKINVPTFIIAGKRDKMTPAFLSVKMHKLIKNSKLSVLEWGSHTAPIEQPEMVNLLIEDFLLENNL